MNGQLILWAVVFIIAVIAEIATLQLVSVWFAIGAIVALISSFFLPFGFQLGIFIAVSLLSFLVTRPFLTRLIPAFTPTNHDREIGSKGVVIEEINSHTGTGRVKLNGIDWKAVSLDGSVIKSGEPVFVRKISGAHLVIEKCKLLDDPDKQEAEVFKKYSDMQ